MGYSTKQTQMDYPEIARAYQLYLLCRAQTVIVYSESKGKDKTVQKIRPYTTGFGILPDEGGLQDQNHRLLSFMEIFLNGEHDGFASDKR
jgi:hypothetical protein